MNHYISVENIEYQNIINTFDLHLSLTNNSRIQELANGFWDFELELNGGCVVRTRHPTFPDTGGFP